MPLSPPIHPCSSSSLQAEMKYGEIFHFSHPYHKLRFEYMEVPFRCDGCKEVGIGSRFKCTLCDYNLHKNCALPTANNSVFHHPFYSKCSFQFLARPPGNIRRYCNACERSVRGFVYHCWSCGFDLHPCCADLPHVLETGEVTLYLQRKLRVPCHRCARKGRSWGYRSDCKEYNLHVACVMEILVESWHEIYFSGGFAGSRGLERSRIPSIRGARQSVHRSKGKVKKCCEIAVLALQFVISALLGDPTAIIAGVVGTFIAR